MHAPHLCACTKTSSADKQSHACGAVPILRIHLQPKQLHRGSSRPPCRNLRPRRCRARCPSRVLPPHCLITIVHGDRWWRWPQQQQQPQQQHVGERQQLHRPQQVFPPISHPLTLHSHGNFGHTRGVRFSRPLNCTIFYI